MASSQNRNSTRFERRRNFIIVWVDSNVQTMDSNTKDTIEKLNKITTDVELLFKPDQCIETLKQFNGTRSFVITSGSFGQHLVPEIHSIKHLESIFVFCGNKKYHESWVKDWNKIRGVHTKINPICDELYKLVNQIKQDDISISFIEIDDDYTKELNQLEPSFMYTRLLKDTILNMDFSRQHLEKLIDSFNIRYKDDSTQLEVIKEFASTYQYETAIWWYTRQCFTYIDVNRSLRILEGDIIIEMGFFIRDLHKQLESLYSQQQSQFGSKTFIVYRGQGLSKEHFQQLKNSIGGLLGFNAFLSTSRNDSVAIEFAQGGSERPDHVGVLFILTIDPKLKTVSFADISGLSYFKTEAEILFAMHSIFKITSVEKLPGHTGLFQASLVLTSDDDPQLQRLERYMSDQYGGHGGHRLGRILLAMGQNETAEKVYLDLLEDEKDERDRGTWYHCIGLIMDRRGKYREAIEYYEMFLEIEKRILTDDDPNLATTYNNIGAVYDKMGEYEEALLYHKKSLEILRKTLPNEHPAIATSYNNIGLVYEKMGEYERALLNHEKSLEIKREILPSEHPSIATSCSCIGSVYDKMGEYEKAFLKYEKSLDIRKKTLPSEHPDIATSYAWIGFVYDKMGEYEKALLNHEKSLELRQKTLPSEHPDIATSYAWIGFVYDKMGEYEKALLNHEKSLEIFKKTLSTEHPDVACSYKNFGLVYYHLGEYDKSLSYHEKALNIRKKTLTEDHPRMGESYFNIGKIKYRKKEFVDSLKYLETAAEIYRKKLPEKHPDRKEVNDWILEVKKKI